MAAAATIRLGTAQVQPQFVRPGITEASSQKVNQLLQENHEQHHIFFNSSGFHNHIAHHLLTIWALRAQPSEIQKAYDINKSYQRSMSQPKPSIVQDLHDPRKFKASLGPETHYKDFLAFFVAEIDKLGWQAVLQKYLFAGDERADDLLARSFAGVLHPIIHLGFGVEFNQPAIIAEGLAQAACHKNWTSKYLFPAEKAAKESQSQTGKSLVQLLEQIRADPELQKAIHYDDNDKVSGGLVARAGDRIIHHVAQVHVDPSQLQEKVAEMTNAATYFTAGAQRSDRAAKYDFFFIHCLNSSIFFPAFLQQDWLSDANKVRLLEWKIRMDFLIYASAKSPQVRLDLVRNYTPEKPSDWAAVLDRACALEDDGHAAKLVRALAHGQQISKPYESSDAFPIKQDDWLRLAHMAIDSVQSEGPEWVRFPGFDEAWQDVPARTRL